MGIVQKAYNAGRGMLFIIIISFFAAVCCIMMLPWILLLPIPIKQIALIRRVYLRQVNRCYFSFCAMVIQYYSQTKVLIHSKNKEYLNDKKLIIMCNHRSTIDWMYAGWVYATFLQKYPQITFVTKQSLRGAPLYGWAMQMMAYVFLKRNRDEDVPIIKNSVNYLLDVDTDPCIFIFPEGTDLSPSNIVKSHKCEA